MSTTKLPIGAYQNTKIYCNFFVSVIELGVVLDSFSCKTEKDVQIIGQNPKGRECARGSSKKPTATMQPKMLQKLLGHESLKPFA